MFKSKRTKVYQDAPTVDLHRQVVQVFYMRIFTAVVCSTI